MKNKNTYKRGFTLPEVIVSIAVIVTVITSATDVLVTVMRTNTDNQNTLVAFGLAQEGIEGIRMIRDSNFLIGLGMDGKPENGDAVWGESLVDQGVAKKELILIKNLEPADNCSPKIDLKNCLPYSLALAEEGNQQITKNENGVMLQGAQLSGELTLTNFSRVIAVVPDETDPGHLNVSSEVSWPDSNGEVRKVVLNTILTDWKFKK